MKLNSLIPELKASNFAHSLAFYTGCLGFRIAYERPERQFAMLSYQGCQLMLEQANDTWKTGDLEYPFGRGINIQMRIGDIGVMLESLAAHDYPVMMGPEEHWYRSDSEYIGQREFLVLDPDGYLLRFAQPLGVRSG